MYAYKGLTLESESQYKLEICMDNFLMELTLALKNIKEPPPSMHLRSHLTDCSNHLIFWGENGLEEEELICVKSHRYEEAELDQMAET